MESKLEFYNLILKDNDLHDFSFLSDVFELKMSYFRIKILMSHSLDEIDCFMKRNRVFKIKIVFFFPHF